MIYSPKCEANIARNERASSKPKSLVFCIVPEQTDRIQGNMIKQKLITQKIPAQNYSQREKDVENESWRENDDSTHHADETFERLYPHLGLEFPDPSSERFDNRGVGIPADDG